MPTSTMFSSHIFSITHFILDFTPQSKCSLALENKVHLLCTHKDLSMDFQHLHKKPGVIVHLCNPVLSGVEAKIDGSRALLTSLFS